MSSYFQHVLKTLPYSSWFQFGMVDVLTVMERIRNVPVWSRCSSPGPLVSVGSRGCGTGPLTSVFGGQREGGGDTEDLGQHVAELVEHLVGDTLWKTQTRR